jgi:hypothetical protein
VSRILITALFAPLTAGNTKEIVYVPEGKHVITPKSHPKGVTVNVPPERGEAIAAALDAELQKRHGNNVKPWFDFEHSRKYPSAGKPIAFSYEKGKGIICTVEWSRSGREAIEGGDVGYFSPEVYIDANGIPNGIPDRGPVGGLVMEPAFRDIPAVTATDADTHSTPNAMSQLLILATIGLLSREEASLENAETLGRDRLTALKAQAARIPEIEGKVTAAEKERDELKTKVTAAETAVQEAAKKRAEDLVKAAVTDGRIAGQDEETKKGFTERISAGDAFAEKMLGGLPKLHEGLGTPLITAGAADRTAGGEKNDGAHAFVVEARKLVTAKQAEDEEEAMAIVASEKPKLYKEYCDSI